MSSLGFAPFDTDPINLDSVRFLLEDDYYRVDSKIRDLEMDLDKIKDQTFGKVHIVKALKSARKEKEYIKLQLYLLHQNTFT